MIVDGLILFAAGVLGGTAPVFVSRTDRALHLLIALATGIFLGAVFLHLLPDVARMAGDNNALWGCVLLGVVVLFALENLIFDRSDPSDQKRHTILGYASFLGLFIHALTAGIGLAAADNLPGMDTPLFFSIVVHKVSEGFSLATVFLLAGLRRGSTLWVIVAFSLATPVGLAIGDWLSGNLSQFGIQVLTSLAAGTFLFVALCDLLPEVFHHREDGGWKIGLIVIGVALSLLIESAGH